MYFYAYIFIYFYFFIINFVTLIKVFLINNNKFKEKNSINICSYETKFILQYLF